MYEENFCSSSLITYILLHFVIYQVYTQKRVTSDKFKTGREQYIQKEVLSDEATDIIIGRIPVMVKSDLCWMKGVEKGDCDFDHGGYFIIKGAEKVSLELLIFVFHIIVYLCYNFILCFFSCTVNW